MPQQARAQATRKSIVEGAAKVFLNVGYARTTVAQVAVASGVTKGALYFHFDSKEALARAVIEENLSATTAIGLRVLSGGYSALESLVRISAGVASELIEEPMTRAAVRLTMEDSDLQFREDVPYVEWIKTCETLVQRAIDEGSVRDDIDVQTLARFLVSAHTGVDTVSGIVADREDLLQRLQEMWTMVLPGIVPPDKHVQYLGLAHLVRQPEVGTQA
jgi:AcrR family transcriptional regulator